MGAEEAGAVAAGAVVVKVGPEAVVVVVAGIFA